MIQPRKGVWKFSAGALGDWSEIELEAMSLERLCHHECHEAGIQDVRSQFLEFDASLAG